MNFTSDKVTEIFYLADEFCSEFKKALIPNLIGNLPKRKPKMSNSEIITIMVLFHTGGYRNMKHFYLNYVQKHMTGEFPTSVSYNRFTELMQSVTLANDYFS